MSRQDVRHIRFFRLAVFFAVPALLLVGCSGLSLPDRVVSTPSSSASSTLQPSEGAMPSKTTESSQTPQPSSTSQPTSSSSPSQSASAEQSEDSGNSTPQSVSYSITGGCYGSYEVFGSYTLFEEYADDCFFMVEVSPATPARTVQLQYYADSWITESTGTTDSSGIVFLEVDAYCDDGLWCNGAWDYRVFSASTGGQPQYASDSRELQFESE